MGIIGDIVDATKSMISTNTSNAYGDKSGETYSFYNNQNNDQANLKELQNALDSQLSTQNYNQNSALSKQSADQQLALQQQQQEYNLNYDSTKYQRQIADMEQAGLNPALAYGGISQAQGQSASIGSNLQPTKKESTANQKLQIKKSVNSAFKQGAFMSAYNKALQYGKQASNGNKQAIKNYHNQLRTLKNIL